MNKKNLEKSKQPGSVWKPRWDFIFDKGITLLVIAAILWQGGYFPMQFTVFFFILSLFLLLDVLIRKTPVMVNRRAIYLLLGFGGFYILASLISSSNRYMGILESVKALCFVLFFMVMSIRSKTENLVNGVLTGSLLLGIVGILGYLDLFDLIPGITLASGNNLRLQSLLQYANITAVFMGVGYFAANYALGKNKQRFDQIKLYIYSILFLVSMILTFSRGTFLVFGLVALIWLLLLRDLKTTLLFFWGFPVALAAAVGMNYFSTGEMYAYSGGVLILGLGLAGVGYMLVQRYAEKIHWKKAAVVFAAAIGGLVVASFFIELPGLSRLLRISIFEGTLVERYVYTKDGFAALMDHPLLGIGPGDWGSRQFTYQTAQYYAKYIHNGYMQIALDAGIFALIAFLGVVILYFRSVWRRFRGMGAGFDRKDWALPVMVLFILLHSLIDIDLSFTSLFIILSGLLALGMEQKPVREKVKETGSRWFLMKYAGIVCLAFMMLIAGGLFAGTMLYSRAQDLYLDDRLEDAAEICRINRVLRPWDSENMVLLAVIAKERMEKRESYLQYYREAHRLDPYQPKFLSGLLEEMMAAGELEKAYEISGQLMDVQPLNEKDVNHYNQSLHLLTLMLNNQKMTKEKFLAEGAQILEKARKADGRITSLAKYLRDQSRIEVDQKYLVYFNSTKF